MNIIINPERIAWKDIVARPLIDRQSLAPMVNDVLTPSSTVAGSDPLLWNQAYIYNAIWNRIETEVNAEGLSASAAKEAYENMRGTFEWLIGDGSDEDSIALLAYLDAVASQRGLSEKK